MPSELPPLVVQLMLEILSPEPPEQPEKPELQIVGGGGTLLLIVLA